MTPLATPEELKYLRSKVAGYAPLLSHSAGLAMIAKGLLLRKVNGYVVTDHGKWAARTQRVN